MAHRDIQDQGLPSPFHGFGVLLEQWRRRGWKLHLLRWGHSRRWGRRPPLRYLARDRRRGRSPRAARAAQVRGCGQRLFHARRWNCWPLTPRLACARRRGCWPHTLRLARARRQGRAFVCSHVQAAQVRGRTPAHIGKAWAAQDLLASPPIASRRPYLGFVGEELPSRSGCGSTREGGVWIR
jgi:hypothetical protein